MATLFQHFTADPERNSGHLGYPIIRCFIVIEIFAKPQPGNVRDVFHVQEDAVDVSVARIVLIGRMQVDDYLISVPVHDTGYTLHRLPAECDIIQIQSVDLLVLRQPIQAFDVIIGPAGGAFVQNGCIVHLRSMPGGMIVVFEVLLQPAVTTAITVIEDLIAQAPQGKEFIGMIGEFTDRIIQLHFNTFGMRFVDVGFHGIEGEEWIVDVWIDGLGVVYIDHRSTPRYRRINRHIFVHKPGG